MKNFPLGTSYGFVLITFRLSHDGVDVLYVHGVSHLRVHGAVSMDLKLGRVVYPSLTTCLCLLSLECRLVK